MSQFFEIHPVTPQRRLIRRAVEILEGAGVMAYPTDSTYALGCRVGEKSAADRIRRLRGDGNEHKFTLVCRDLSELATYARVEKPAFRLLKALTPGPYTFVLPATREVPRRLVHPKRKTIGIRVPDNAIVQALLEELGGPLMSVTLVLPGDDLPVTDLIDARPRLEPTVDAIIDGGPCGVEPTTIIDLTAEPAVVRAGKGDVQGIEALLSAPVAESRRGVAYNPLDGS
ncbi:MAG TPA: L-threonylcarbamoyladenylate synthase [Gammaproteobacteria bacterium]|nr:L-threonylcarbamoyladenylate synthase [Gammaproteobacteria bacterium]